MGISYCIYKDKNEWDIEKLDIKNDVLKNYKESISTHKITSLNISYQDKLAMEEIEKLSLKFYEYCPKEFSCIRSLEEINNSDMFRSFKPENNLSLIEKSKGKGGSFFLSTYDDLFLIKTVTRNEADTLAKFLLPNLLYHFKKYQDSFLCPIYGLYSLEFSKGCNIYFVVMRNVVGPFKKVVLRQYDLKGSKTNREEDLEIDTGGLKHQTLKDVNFNKLEGNIFINKTDTNHLLNRLQEDSFLLNENNLMDYSLLVTIVDSSEIENILTEKIFEPSAISRSSTFVLSNENFEKNIKEEIINNNSNSNSSGSINETILSKEQIKNLKYYKRYVFKSILQSKVYIISIIDFLQFYHFFKSLETKYKYYIKTRPDDIFDISCVPPAIYQNRFMIYIKSIMIDEKIFRKRVSKFHNEEDRLESLKEKNFSEENDIIHHFESKPIKCPNCQFIIDI